MADDGIGIAAENLPTVFEKFTQGDGSASRRYNGSGLGLSLARELAELHGGSIEATSVLGEGSAFTAVLPISAKDEGEPGAAGAASTGCEGASGTVLGREGASDAKDEEG